MFYYGEHLPHWHPPGRILFLTTRLSTSLPQALISQLRQLAHETDAASQQANRHLFAQLDHHLDYGLYGPNWLGESSIQKMVIDALHFQVNQGYFDLLAACVMPNHLHVVLRLADSPAKSFRETWADFKRFTGRQANAQLQQSGDFWATESYDHVIREKPDALQRAIRYTINNPVAARLAATWTDWPGTWVHPDWVWVAT